MTDIIKLFLPSSSILNANLGCCVLSQNNVSLGCTYSICFEIATNVDDYEDHTDISVIDAVTVIISNNKIKQLKTITYVEKKVHIV